MKELMSNITGRQAAPEISDGHALLDLARGWLKQGNPIVAVELLKAATGSVEAERDRHLRAGIFKETGRAFMMQSDWSSAERYFVGAQQLFLDMDDFIGAAECARNRANVSFQQGAYARSEELCQQALDWAGEANDHQLRATILNTLGAIKSASGDFSEAIKVFTLCLADFRAAGNVIRQGYVLLNIGLSQTELSEYDQAIESLNEALRIAFTEKDLHLVEICYQNIARCHLNMRDPQLARSVSETARKLLPGLSSKALEVELNLIDCRILRLAGNIEAADRKLSMTYNQAVEQNLVQVQADILFEQGQLNRQKGELELAAYKLDAAAEQYCRIGAEKSFHRTIRELETLKRPEAVETV